MYEYHVRQADETPVRVRKKNWTEGNTHYMWVYRTGKFYKEKAIVYSIAETAKANNLKTYGYFEYLLAEIPEHLEDKDLSFCENLLPWSEELPANCRKGK